MTTGNLADYLTEWYAPRKPERDPYDVSDYCEDCGSHWTEPHSTDCTA